MNSATLKKKKGRQSNYELLRIIAMVTIVAGHFESQSVIVSSLSESNLIFTELISSFCRTGVNIFLIIGVWFLVDSDFSARRIITLYGELWLYCAGITLILLLLGEKISARGFLNAFFPMLRGSCWFVPVYIELLLSAPFLKRILNWKKEVLQVFILLLFLLTCVLNTIHKAVESYFDWYMWFCCVYLFIGYYKKHTANNLSKWLNKYTALLAGIVIYLILVWCKLDGLLYLHLSPNVAAEAKALSTQYLNDCKSLPNFACAFLTFYFFQHIDLGKNHFINFISKSTLAVYLIHQSPNFILYLWNNILHVTLWKTSPYYILLLLLSIILIFAASVCIDQIRIYCIEPYFVKSSLYKRIETGLNKLYSGITTR